LQVQLDALALVGFLFSLMTHVIAQHLAGHRVGIGSYTHFFAESAGALSGAACILLAPTWEPGPSHESHSGLRGSGSIGSQG
jgi:hypothetical protein